LTAAWHDMNVVIYRSQPKDRVDARKQYLNPIKSLPERTLN
jgi:hypothetical protein